MFVAVGRSTDKTLALLRWTLLHFGSVELCLAHVHQPSPLIPTLLGKLPAAQANPIMVAQYRRTEWEKTSKLLDSYLRMCLRMKVNARIVTTESEQVQTGLMDLIAQHEVKKLVMGALPENCFRIKNDGKAKYAAKNAPSFCEIMFIYRGKLVWKREALEDVSGGGSEATSSSSPVTGTASFVGSKPLIYDRKEPLGFDEFQRSNSCPATLTETKHCVGNRQVEIGENSMGVGEPYEKMDSALRSSCPSTSSGYTSCPSCPKTKTSSESDLKKEEELYGKLEMAKVLVENLNLDIGVEVLKREELEAGALQAICEVKDFEATYASEVELRKVTEDTVRVLTHEQERLVEETIVIAREIQKTRRNLALLSSGIQETNHHRNEAARELKFIQGSVTSLRKEKKNLQRQTTEADSWLERWRSNGEAGVITYRNGYSGFLEDMPGLVEFSALDLQTATCNYKDSFKLGEEGYGCVYKGELLDKTVAIKQLHANNMQGPSQFQKEVQVLGRVRHPHLVTLIGACPELWSLVYEYLPNGSLENCLFLRSNNSVAPPLSWEDRTRIISEIACALQFLHSSYPEKIIHGNLKPGNIFLDAELHCKIGDFGICRLLTEETLKWSPGFSHNSEPKGAFPYTDPEFHRTGCLTPKSDIYSFGLVILQIMTGKSPIGLVGEVRRAVSHGKLSSVLDATAGDWPASVVEKLVNLGLDFCKLNSQDRPPLTPSVVRDLQKLHISDDRPLPAYFTCPIFHEVMHDPVVAADGFTYERENLYGWLENGRETSPMTNLPLEHLHLTPNHTLRRAIQDWLCKC